MSFEHRLTSSPSVGVAECDDVHEWTGEIGVVGAVWVDVETREWSRAYLVRDPSRLRVAPIVDAIDLEPANARQRRFGEFALIQHGRFPAGGERVPTEE